MLCNAERDFFWLNEDLHYFIPVGINIIFGLYD